MRCAVCDLTTGVVSNVIVAAPTDPAYPGTQFVTVGQSPVDTGWVLQADGSFTYSTSISAADVAAAVSAEEASEGGS